jgi:hypothetical protein
VIERLWLDFDALGASFERQVLDTTSETPEQTARRVHRQVRAGTLTVEPGPPTVS